MPVPTSGFARAGVALDRPGRTCAITESGRW